MANEAASVAAEETPPPAAETALPDPQQLPKSDPAQKAMKESVKPQTPVASMDANKGESSLGCPLEVVHIYYLIFFYNTVIHLLTQRHKVKGVYKNINQWLIQAALAVILVQFFLAKHWPLQLQLTTDSFINHNYTQ